MAAEVRVTNVLMTCAIDSGVGGVQVVFRDLVQWLERNGRHVFLVARSPLPRVGASDAANAWGRRVTRFPMPGIVRDNAFLSILLLLAYSPVAFLHLARTVRRHKIDVINCHFLDPYFIHLVIAARLLRVPIVVSVHGADVDVCPGATFAYRTLCRLVMRGATRIVACSAALAARTGDIFPDARAKITYVHNGLDLSLYQAPLRSRPLPQPYILCACRHVAKKGVDTLLRAFAAVLRDRPDMSLVLLGDGPLLDEHKRLARTLGIEDRVLFMGKVAHEDVAAFFAACALFALPSRDEPFGIVVLEAALYKKAIVCTRVGGVPEIIEDGVSGLMVEVDDVPGMADAMLTVLRDPDLGTRLGFEAYRTLMSRFLWQQRILDYIAVFEGRPKPLVAPASIDSSLDVAVPKA